MNNKNKTKTQTEMSYYGLYLLNYLKENKFEQAADAAFIQTRADEAAEVYERARLEGYPTEGAHERAMNTLVRGLHYSKYNILREVVENEFYREIPEENREAFTLKLLPLVDNVFSIYDLSDDHFTSAIPAALGKESELSLRSLARNFALSPEHDLLYTELTGAVVLYIDEYGI